MFVYANGVEKLLCCCQPLAPAGFFTPVRRGASGTPFPAGSCPHCCMRAYSVLASTDPSSLLLINSSPCVQLIIDSAGTAGSASSTKTFQMLLHDSQLNCVPRAGENGSWLRMR